MKRVAIILSFVSGLAVVLVTATLVLNQAVSATPSRDVVLLRCLETASEPIGVAQSSSSPSAPVIMADSSCAAALASLLNANFKIADVHGDDVFLYTLVRP